MVLVVKVRVRRMAARVSWEAGAAKLTDSRMERESVSFAERERERLKASNMKGE